MNIEFVDVKKDDLKETDDTLSGYVFTENEDPTTLHPLLIEHVAKKVFEIIGLDTFSSDLLSCRTVCKKWRDLITNIMKRKETSRAFTFCGNRNDGLLLKKFINDMRTTVNLPFDTFEFDIHFFIKQNTEIFQDFLWLCGKYIRKLSLNFGKYFSLNLMEMDLESVEFNNLQSLTFKCSVSETLPDSAVTSNYCTWLPPNSHTLSHGLHNLLKYILDTAKTLATFHFILPARYFDGDNADASNANFGELLATSLPETVKTLKLSMALHAEHFRSISRLKLETLDVELYGESVDLDCFKETLTSQYQSLKCIRVIEFHNMIFDKSLSFQEFWNVKSLEIRLTDYSLSFLKFFPMLENLTLLYGPKDSTTESNFEKVCFKTLSSLSLQFPLASLNFIEACRISFPNVVKLNVQIAPHSVKGLRKVFQSFKNLKEMQIYFPEPFKKQDADSLLTGFPLEFCNKIREEGNIVNYPAPVTRNPSLADLLHLSKLTIQSEFDSNVFTEISMHFAFFRMPLLTEVIIIGDHKISSAWIKSARERFKLVIIPDTSEKDDPVNPSDENRLALVPVIS